MAVVLNSLRSVGTDRPEAVVSFHEKRFLIRGPSDTGKSYIRDCLWYLLGGDKLPKTFPLTEGYQELQLRFNSGKFEYEVRRALIGGAAAVYRRALSAEEGHGFEDHEQDIGELLVELSGAKGRQVIRTLSERGPVTGDDVRHWSLWSQTAILSEEPTSGDGFGVAKRTASFNLFLTGVDDAAVQLRKKSSEVERIKGQLTSAEEALKRVQAGLPADATRLEVVDALGRVDSVLTSLTTQYDERASKLREMRREIADVSERLVRAINARNHAKSMIGRFELLEQKYANDLERLGAVREGVAFFEELSLVPCPLCGTPSNGQVHTHDLRSEAPKHYVSAMVAEAQKIGVLRTGLLAALQNEKRRLTTWEGTTSECSSRLAALQDRETQVVQIARTEFSADPKELAIRRSELSAQLAIFDEIERLKVEIERLKKSKLRPKVQVTRDGGTFGRSVADLAKGYLGVWGFKDIDNISLDAEQCDLVINDRPRLSFGAGRRALYLTSLVIALMEHALAVGHPHLGVVVIDSPLKAYADPDSNEPHEVSVGTVTEHFYSWLAGFDGLGQIIVLENERIPAQVASSLRSIEFSGTPGMGRPGFYPLRSRPETNSPASPDDADISPKTDEDPE